MIKKSFWLHALFIMLSSNTTNSICQFYEHQTIWLSSVLCEECKDGVGITIEEFFHCTLGSGNGFHDVWALNITGEWDIRLEAFPCCTNIFSDRSGFGCASSLFPMTSQCHKLRCSYDILSHALNATAITPVVFSQHFFLEREFFSNHFI